MRTFQTPEVGRETNSLISLRRKDNAFHSRFPAPKTILCRHTPPHRPGGNKRQPQGGRKTPKSTAGAEKSLASPSHSFVCSSQEVFRKELKEKSPFSAALGFITRPASFQSFRFRKGKRKGVGVEESL
ncbi:hypothetical protein CDAR_188531 [Caerostris darwini]|uniref:Uncharacterized protein n=1 Tax=Caerostris darwini TaxID=1538125 RepID=A0AAV4V6M2_9ARAC|nr:hypothetical protein CDAR_188401 [Caerostris darwini]GIY65778.1 hypothetical protein CDAR_188531 [Caerostris darwini]